MSNFSGPVQAAQTTVYDYPGRSVDTARVTLDLDIGDLALNPLNDSPNFIEADITYIGDLVPTEQGERDLTVNIAQTNPGSRGLGRMFNIFGVLAWEEDTIPLPWEVNLDPDVPLALSVQGSTGRYSLDLYDFTLTDVSWPDIDTEAALIVNVSAGESIVYLPPAGEAGYTALINTAIGTTTINLPPNANVVLTADVDMGTISVDPQMMRTIAWDDNDAAGDSGEWESREYDPEAPTITLVFTGGIGDVTIEE